MNRQLLDKPWISRTRIHRPDRRTACLRTWKRAAIFLALVAGLSGCERSQPLQAAKPSAKPEVLFKAESTNAPQIEVGASFELYSTLAGKMARMEELLNAIDRFLGVPDFQPRLLADAREFDQLLNQSRGLYPKELPAQEQPRFDQTIEQTAVVSEKLLAALQADNVNAARAALNQLLQHRQAAHARFSR